MPLDLAPIPIVDNHCHSLLRRQPADDDAFRIHLTETYFPEVARDDVPHTLFYQWTIRELAGLLDCEPTPEAVHAARRARGVEALAREVVERANFKTWLIDSGYGADTTFSLEELRAIVPCRIEEVLRLEPMIERLILEAPDFAGFLDAYRASLEDLRGRGIVGLKSVIAYRTGLHVGLVDREDAAAAFAGVHEAARRHGTLRIESKPLLDYLVVLAVEQSASQGVPIQFHTGLGDPDLDLTLVDPNDLHRQAVLLRGGQLLDAHQNAGLARNASDGRFGMRELHAQRVRQTHAHRPQPARVDPAARLVELVELRGPHLVLANVRGDVCFALGHLVELLDHELRLDDGAGPVVLETVAPSPRLDLRPPGFERLGIGALARGRELPVHLLQHFAHVADDGNVDLHALRDRRWIDVDVDDLALLLVEVLRVADHAIVEARAHGEQHVAMLHGHVGFVSAVHAEHAGEQRVGGRETRPAPSAYWCTGKPSVRTSWVSSADGVAEDHAAAGVDHRALGLQNELDRLLDLPRVAFDHRVVGTQADAVRIVELRLGLLHVLRDVDQHRPGPPGLRDVERLLDGERKVLDVLDQEVVLDARARDPDGVHLLECVLADGVRSAPGR